MSFWPYVSAVPPCAGRALPGTRHVQMAIMDRFDHAIDYGIYNCRASTSNTAVPSIHSDGRAGDVGFPVLGGQPHYEGFVLVRVLLDHKEALGLQGIIWNRTRWDWRTPWGREYTGPNPHVDHVHWEQHPTLANSLTQQTADRLIGVEDMAFTSAEEAILRQVAAQGATLVQLAKGLTSPGPVTGKVGNGMSPVWVLEWYRLFAQNKGVSPLNPTELARLLGQ